jgi:hypothetical protein
MQCMDISTIIKIEVGGEFTVQQSEPSDLIQSNDHYLRGDTSSLSTQRKGGNISMLLVHSFIHPSYMPRPSPRSPATCAAAVLHGGKDPPQPRTPRLPRSGCHRSLPPYFATGRQLGAARATRAARAATAWPEPQLAAPEVDAELRVRAVMAGGSASRRSSAHVS